MTSRSCLARHMVRCRGTIKCTCDAYSFPHRLGGGKCERKFTPAHGPDEMDLARDEAIRQMEKENEQSNHNPS